MHDERVLEGDLIRLTDMDLVRWDRADENGISRFSVNIKGIIVIIEMRIRGPVLLLAAGLHESLLSSATYQGLWRAIRRQTERGDIDAEFSRLLDSYKK